jgi:4-hydroxybutyrate CoA-transferase
VRVFVGEGTHEPVVGLHAVATGLRGRKAEFLFGVRRTAAGLDGLDDPAWTISAMVPGRGLRRFAETLRYRRVTPHGLTRGLGSGAVSAHVAIVVASQPDRLGKRSLGTTNGPWQAILDKVSSVVVEEDPDLPCVNGAAQVEPSKVSAVHEHHPVPYVAISRAVDDVDRAIADRILHHLPDGATVQVGVGGVMDALAGSGRGPVNLRIRTGALTHTMRDWWEGGRLQAGDIPLGTALVGPPDLARWAAFTGAFRLGRSETLHDPRTLGREPVFFAINAALAADLDGNVYNERIGGRLVSGRGGAPNFAAGARRSVGGTSVFAVRRGLEPAAVEGERPSITASLVDVIVTDSGLVDLRGMSGKDRRRRLERILGWG